MATAEAKVAAATVDTWVFETVYPTTRPFVLVVKDGVEDGSIKISLVENAVELTSFLVSDVDSLVTMVNASDYIRVKTKGKANEAFFVGDITPNESPEKIYQKLSTVF